MQAPMNGGGIARSDAQAGRPAAGIVFSPRGVTKTYTMGEVQVHALKNIDLDIRDGEFIVLLGASGSGKSTLLNILGGLDTPTTSTQRKHKQELTQAGDAALTRFRREHV